MPFLGPPFCLDPFVGPAIGLPWPSNRGRASEPPSLRASEPPLEEMLTPDERDQATSVLVEIRPGVGGDEACLWAEDLSNMRPGERAREGRGGGGGGRRAGNLFSAGV